MEPNGPDDPDLTQRQRALRRFYEDYIEQNVHAPSMREAAAAVGLKSTSSVAYQLEQLRKKGYLSSDFGRPRTTIPTRKAHPQSPPGSGARERTLVPVVGRIAAGGEVTAVDLTAGEEYVHVPPGIVGAHDHFALEVAGDSMIGKAIIDGDRVVVRSGSEARNGDTVVAWFPDADTSPEQGEATLKTYKRVGGHVWLIGESRLRPDSRRRGGHPRQGCLRLPRGALSSRVGNAGQRESDLPLTWRVPVVDLAG
jgi:repressor LexA